MTTTIGRPRRALRGVSVAVVAVAAVFALRLLTRPSRTATPPGGAPAVAARAVVEPPALPPVEPAPLAVEPGPEMPAVAADVGVESVDRVRKSLEIYKATMVYPPWSRPIDDSTRHLLAWNQPWPIGQPFAADADRREIRVDASLDKLFAGAGESFTATVAVTYEEAPHAPVVPRQLSGRIQYLDGDWKTAADVTFARAGDRYVATFTPSKIAGLTARPREAQLLVHVDMGEQFPKDLPIAFQYAAVDTFTVTGLAGDRVTTDGSLEVSLAVDVKHLAPTLIQAFLFDADGKRGIATYSDYFHPTALGPQLVPIQFFGKSIFDSRVSGHYRVQGLNGHVKVPGATPPEVFWARRDEPPLITKGGYASSQFTREAWASAEKDAKIRQYEQLLRDLGSTP